MDAFNTINLIINSVALAAANANNQKSAPVAQNTENALQYAANSSSNTAAGTYSSQANAAYALSSENALLISTVEIEQRANYIKDLLSLPRDFDSFINLISSNAQNLNIAEIFKDGKINLNILAQLLNANSKEAANKLMQTIMTVSKMGSNNVSELKELMNAFLNADASKDNAATLKNLIMLYLPWLPLSVRNNLNLNFDMEFSGGGGEDELETVKIMIETVNFGNVLIILELNNSGEIDVYITASADFPSDKIKKEFARDSEKHNIKSNVSVELNSKNVKKDIKKSNVEITSSNFVSAKLLTAAYSIIKIVTSVDLEKNIINEKKEG